MPMPRLCYTVLMTPRAAVAMAFFVAEVDWGSFAWQSQGRSVNKTEGV